MGIRHGKMALATIVVASLSGTALADPLSDLMQRGGACYSRVYDQAHLDKHPGQKTTEVRLSLRDEAGDGAVIRIMLKEKQRTNYIAGGCNWAAKANLDVQDKPLIEAFKGPSGLNCYALTSEDGSSAEEGGDFPIDIRNGKSILLYLPDSIAAWPSFDRSGMADFPEFGTEDQVFRLDRTDAAACREIDEKLPWLL